MFGSVGIIVVNNKILTGESKNKSCEFFIKHLKLLKYQLEKVVVIIENENVLTKELYTFTKQYDIVLVIGELKNDVVFKALGNICNNSAMDNKILKSNSENLVMLPLAAKLLFSDNLSYPVIYFQRIFILKEESAQVQFFEVLKSHLEQYTILPTFKKNIKVHMNGNSKKILDSLNKLVNVDMHIEHNALTVVLSSHCFDNIIEAEELLKSELDNNFIESTEDTDLFTRIFSSSDENILHSLKVIDDCISAYGPDNVFISFNGGKDCTVLLHLVYTVLKQKYPSYTKPILCLYVKSSEPFPEQDLFISQCKTFYNLDIMVVSSSIKKALEQILTVKTNLKACFMGTRRTDPFSANLKDFQMTDPDWPQVMRVNPILDWHYSDIWDYLLFYKIPYCKLYDLGFTSIGNLSNTIRNPALTFLDIKLNQEMYLPAYKLLKECEERSGRIQ